MAKNHGTSLMDVPLVQFSTFNNFLWVWWLLCKNLPNFVYPVWKLNNPYCHNGKVDSFWNLGVLAVIYCLSLFLSSEPPNLQRYTYFILPFFVFWFRGVHFACNCIQNCLIKFVRVVSWLKFDYLIIPICF